MVVVGRRVQRNRVMPPVTLVTVDAAAPCALSFHLAEPAAQATDPRLSSVPSLSVVAAAAPAEYFALEPGAQVDKPATLFAPPAASVDLADAYVATSPSTPPAPLVSVIAAATSAP